MNLQTHPNQRYHQDLAVWATDGTLAVVRDMHRDMDSSCDSRDDWETLMELEEALAGWLIQGSDWDQNWHWGPRDDPYQDEDIPAVSLCKDSTKEYAIV